MEHGFDFLEGYVFILAVVVNVYVLLCHVMPLEVEIYRQRIF